MRLGVDDLGFRQGVTAVERLRTYSGRVFALDAHLDRWQRSVGALGIQGLPSPVTITTLLSELLNRNARIVQSETDVGITMFATPGEPGRGTPTFGLHLNPLNHARILRHRRQGQPLVVTNVTQPSPACWPRAIKVRSRIHYYRADAMAQEHSDDAVGILLDDDATITETSIANLAIVRSGEILSPPADRVLGGITQSVIESLASEAKIAWRKRPISLPELAQADEILMMGTDGGIWFAASVNGHPIGEGKGGKVYRHLRDRFDALVREASSQRTP